MVYWDGKQNHLTGETGSMTDAQQREAARQFYYTWNLYDLLTMPPELRKAHQKNDAAVMAAYGMPIKETDEAACVFV